MVGFLDDESAVQNSKIEILRQCFFGVPGSQNMDKKGGINLGPLFFILVENNAKIGKIAFILKSLIEILITDFQ